MSEALSQADILIATGGSSMGSSDLLKPVIERYLGGTVHFGRVAVKPGKPTTFATIPSPPVRAGEKRGPSKRKPVFALPGNPASALVMFYVFVVPALRRLGGRDTHSCSLPHVPVQVRGIAWCLLALHVVVLTCCACRLWTICPSTHVQSFIAFIFAEQVQV